MNEERLQRITTQDTNKAVNIANNIWWVGHYLPGDPFQSHAYLIEKGDNSVLIDPGSPLTFDHVLEKVRQVTPFANIRYFICHHQDPDVAGSLNVIDNMSDRHAEAVVVTHSRASVLLRHYDIEMPFLDIDHNQWKLHIDGQVLEFIFTPYLHFPGAFTTFDRKSGILFSSDLFGGMTENWNLIAKDESYFDDIRPFHEHYMPSNEILVHSLLNLEKHPIKLIAPQHGSLIPENLVARIISDLKQIDCGLYGMTDDISDIRRLSELNRTLREITQAVILYRDFRDIVHRLLGIFKEKLPVSRIDFCASTFEHQNLFLSESNRYHGTEFSPLSDCCHIRGMSKEEWDKKHDSRFIDQSCDGHEENKENEKNILIPLFSAETERAQAVAIITLDKEIDLGPMETYMIEQMSDILGVAVERESMYRMMEMERQKFYELSITDPLTGLYNRAYMKETINRFISIHDREKKAGIVAIMCDIDEFKMINDTYGHDVGDLVLQKISERLIKSIRSGDIAVRYGGEEFILFLIDCSLNAAIKTTKKISKSIKELYFNCHGNGFSITISAGIASYRPGESSEELIRRADMKLLEAKNSGRNRICIED